jgi:AraC family transcriptional regulator
MQVHCLRIDRGAVEDSVGLGDVAARVRLAFLSRAGRIALAGPHATVWVAVRGGVRLQAREGRFDLAPGDWIALDHDARPTLVAGRRALVIGFVLPVNAPALELPGLPPLHPGRGRLDARSLRRALRLWREAATEGDAGLARLVSFLAAVQAPLEALVERCPGRSLRRKRQVFARMQRARLHLDGHAGLPVRLAQLAELCNFSIWHFTKTFQALYGEGPREAIANARLQQASELLARTSLPVGAVGAACGFENPCSFSRAFRAHYGTTASRYRASRRGGDVWCEAAAG